MPRDGYHIIPVQKLDRVKITGVLKDDVWFEKAVHGKAHVEIPSNTRLQGRHPVTQLMVDGIFLKAQDNPKRTGPVIVVGQNAVPAADFINALLVVRGLP